MVKRMERRNRGMESIRDIEDDAGPVFKCSRLAGATIFMWRCENRKGRLKITIH